MNNSVNDVMTSSKKSERINESVNINNVDFDRVYKFTDVSKFKLHPKNRDIDQKLVKKYMDSMLNGASDDLIGLMVIDINTFEEYDGQHRIEAYKEASKKGFGRPLRVIFIDAPKDEAEQIKLINDLNNGKHWNDKDHINSHIDGDNELRRLETFCLEHNRLFNLRKTGKEKGKKTAFFRRGAAIVTGDPSYYKKSLRDGTFKASKDKWEDADKVYSEVMNILDATRLSSQTDVPAFEGIINGWYAVRNNIYNIKKINQLPNKLDDVYKFMTPDNMDVRHTTSAEIWRRRFETAVENAYSAFC